MSTLDTKGKSVAGKCKVLEAKKERMETPLGAPSGSCGFTSRVPSRQAEH